jgi:hypothetical protein
VVVFSLLVVFLVMTAPRRGSSSVVVGVASAEKLRRQIEAD